MLGNAERRGGDTMRIEKAKAAFPEAKQGFSPHTLEQYKRALNYLGYGKLPW